MKYTDLKVKSFGNYKTYMADVKRDLAKQHTEIVNESLKTAELDGRGKLTSGSFNRSVQKDLEKISKQQPTIYKKPQAKYP